MIVKENPIQRPETSISSRLDIYLVTLIVKVEKWIM